MPHSQVAELRSVFSWLLILCAATVAANIKSFSKNECIIHFKDGSLKIDYNKNVGKVFMSGQVSKIEKISFNY